MLPRDTDTCSSGTKKQNTRGVAKYPEQANRTPKPNVFALLLLRNDRTTEKALWSRSCLVIAKSNQTYKCLDHPAAFQSAEARRPPGSPVHAIEHGPFVRSARCGQKQ